ncbi:hypothetical protein D9611_000379 [Ephemerocybe angulata]|uniref:SET domain-containing protein n=1 Tax=Ephemerocybe angulata TaxID=980116 RepID=A0A8H5BNI8_9AGAR|nr:hypothetical protein D9611_000379 [Tulosesus angulatus]
MPSKSKKSKTKDRSSKSKVDTTYEDDDWSAETIPAGCRRSESPFESFDDAEGADEYGHWQLDIVGEEIDYYNRICLKVEWGTWKRKDGTNGTWKNEYIGSRPDIFNSWKRQQATQRRREMKESLSYEFSTSLDIHNNDTRLRAQAFEEKLEERKKNPLNWEEARLKQLAEEEERGLEDGDDEELVSGVPRKLRALKSRSQPRSSSAWPSQPTSTHRFVSDKVASSSSVARTPASSLTPLPSAGSCPTPLFSSQEPTPSTSRMTLTPESSQASLHSMPLDGTQEIPVFDNFHPRQPPMSEKARGKRPAREVVSTPSSSGSHKRRRLVLSPREVLSDEWSRFGAPITFRNDVDDEEIPPLGPNFRYIERGYVYDDGIPGVDECRDFLLSCSGHDVCGPSRIGNCDCQGESHLDDETGRVLCAYNKKGLFRFNVLRGVEVKECTPLCKCSPDCPNRVLQRDRDIPLEIFKTLDRGWGVRTKKKLPRGKVLGMYTGLLLRRAKALKVHSAYCFDLDGQESLSDSEDEPLTEDSYSVDSQDIGNWSRFMNHSCDPNTVVYEAVYDQMPSTGMPYLAFAAVRDIPAGEELTFNYKGVNAELEANTPISPKKKKSGGRKVVSSDDEGSFSRECRCGAAKCRGYYV